MVDQKTSVFKTAQNPVVFPLCSVARNLCRNLHRRPSGRSSLTKKSVRFFPGGNNGRLSIDDRLACLKRFNRGDEASRVNADIFPLIINRKVRKQMVGYEYLWQCVKQSK